MGILKSIGKIAAPAVGTALGGQIGGMLGSGIAGAISDKEAQDAAEEAFERNAALQREFAQYGIRWRVEDAKAAGVHPVYALGAGGAAFAPVSINAPRTDWAAMGQNMARAVSAQMDAGQLELQKANLELIRAQTAKETAIANSYSTARVANQPGQVPFPDAGAGPVDMTGFLNRSSINAVDVDSMSNTPGVAAGPAGPGGYLHNIGGQPMLLPGKSISEALESLSESPLLMGIYYKVNEKHFGEAYMDQFMRDFVPFGNEALGVRDFARAVGAAAGAARMAEGKSYPMPPAVRPDTFERAQGNWMTREQWKAQEFRRRNAVGPSRWRRNVP